MIFVLATLLLCALSSALAGLAGATTAVPALSQAMRGYTHLKNGESLLKGVSTGVLSATTVQQAQVEFAASQRDVRPRAHRWPVRQSHLLVHLRDAGRWFGRLPGIATGEQ